MRNTARYVKGQAVVICRKHTLLGIVTHVDILPVGKPGPGRYRYMVQPARLVDGQAQVIAAALAVPHVHGRQLRAFEPTIHTNPWRMA